MPLQDDLVRLFLLEKQVRGLSSRLDGALRRQKAQQTRLDQLSQQHQELTSQRRHAQAKAGDLEGQAAEVESRIEKLRQQMNTVTTNREYSAILVEVNTLKIEKGKFEEQALEQMSEVERLDGEIKALDEQIADRQKLAGAAVGDVEKAKADVGEELDAFKAQRDEAASRVPDDIRRTFFRLCDAYDGEGMAAIEEVDRRRMEYQCGGCFMHIPVERVNALMGGGDDPVVCTSCGRFLYVEDQLRSSLQPKSSNASG